MTDHELLENILTLARARAAEDHSDPIRSVIAQIEYVVAHLAGSNDGARLGEVIVGVQASREYDQDERFATLLYKTQALSDRLRAGGRA